MKIIIVGPAHPYRGGIAAFTDRLATEFVAEDVDVEDFGTICHTDERSGNQCYNRRANALEYGLYCG